MGIVRTVGIPAGIVVSLLIVMAFFVTEYDDARLAD